MGIHNLNKLLRSNCNEIFEEVHLSKYAFKKIAIDTSLYMCKYKVCYGDKWLNAFINLVATLRRNEIHCVFIYDTGSPIEKTEEKAERTDKKKILQDKVASISKALDTYYKTKHIDDCLVEFHNKRNKLPNLLTKNKININFVEAELEKIKLQVINISKEDFLLTKKLFTILQVPFFDAPLESETTCSDLCIRGVVDAVLSEDTDVLAYGSPIFLSKLDLMKETVIEINYNKLLNCLDLTSEQFLDICIMCGTDYNKNIHKIGPEKSYKYIKTYKSIENVKDKLKIDVSVLNHVRVRELFRNYKHLDVYVPYCGQPIFKDIKKFINENKISVNIDVLYDSFIHNIMVFEECETKKDTVMTNKEEVVEKEVVEDEVVKEEVVKDEVIEEEVFEDEVVKDEVVKDEVVKDEVVEKEVVEDEVVEDEVVEDEVVEDEVVKDEVVKDEEDNIEYVYEYVYE